MMEMMMAEGSGYNNVKKKTGEMRIITILIGNPKRAVWKRPMWKGGSLLHVNFSEAG